MTKEEIAFKIGNRISNITEIECPRGVANPGLYFGAMLALLEVERKQLIKKSIDEIIEAHKETFKKLKENL